MKKLVCLLLAFIFILSFVACGNNDDNTSSINDVIVESDIESEPVESEPMESEPEESEPVESEPVESESEESKPVESQQVHQHSYTNSVTTQPTCTQKGVKTFKCSCGDSYTEDVAATDQHNWSAATCKSPKTCTVCGSVEGGNGSHTLKGGICTVCNYVDTSHTMLKPEATGLYIYTEYDSEKNTVNVYEFDWNSATLTVKYSMKSYDVVQNEDANTINIDGKICRLNNTYNYEILSVEASDYEIYFSIGPDYYGYGAILLEDNQLLIRDTTWSPGYDPENPSIFKIQ